METLFNLQSSIFGPKTKFAMNLHTFLARTQANIQIQHVYLTAYVQLASKESECLKSSSNNAMLWLLFRIDGSVISAPKVIIYIFESPEF